MITQNGKPAGYIFNFQGNAFDPNGKQRECCQAEIDQHNKELAALEWESLKQSGRGILYISGVPGNCTIGDWTGTKKIPAFRAKTSRNNWGAPRVDVWFNFDGSTWHGVNLGDNQIVRVKRNNL